MQSLVGNEISFNTKPLCSYISESIQMSRFFYDARLGHSIYTIKQTTNFEKFVKLMNQLWIYVFNHLNNMLILSVSDINTLGHKFTVTSVILSCFTSNYIICISPKFGNGGSSISEVRGLDNKHQKNPEHDIWFSTILNCTVVGVLRLRSDWVITQQTQQTQQMCVCIYCIYVRLVVLLNN